MTRKNQFLKSIGITNQRHFRLLLRGSAIVIGSFAAYFVSLCHELHFWTQAWVAFAVLLAAAILEFTVSDYLAVSAFPYSTEEKLANMEARLGEQAINAISECLSLIIGRLRACDKQRVSATVHVLIELETANKSASMGLLQLTNYVGFEGGKKGRITLLNQGVIGRCARTEDLETVEFADINEYRTRMVREFGFTRLEAQNHSANARSYLAYPLKDGERLVGVMYFFSTEPQVFPESSNSIDWDQ